MPEASFTRSELGGWGDGAAVCLGDGLGHIIENLHWPGNQARKGSRGGGAGAVKRNGFSCPSTDRQRKGLKQEPATSWFCCLMQNEVNH